MANVFLAPGDSRPAFTGDLFFGSTGTENATIQVDSKGNTDTGISIDQNIESVTFPGASSSYTFQQAGNTLKVFSAGTLAATIIVQDDASGTVLVFSNGTTEAKLSGTTLLLGGVAVPTTTPGAVIPGDIGGTGSGGTGTVVTLTNQPDIVSGNTFNAPRGFTPGGTDQVNTLDDDDQLTGTGANDVLNFTFVTNADIPQSVITPTLNSVETVNVAFDTQQATAQLDLQDSTGVQNVNLSRISAGTTLASILNMKAVPLSLSVNNTSAPAATVEFKILNSALAGANDATTLTLNNANIGTLYLGGETHVAGVGIEGLALVSKGGQNTVGVLDVENLKTLVITGDSNLTLGGSNTVVRPAVGGVAGQVEAFTYTAGLADVAGSLTKIDASQLGGSLTINLGTEVTALTDGSSGAKVDFNLIGTAQDDTIRLLNGFDSPGDHIDGGAGNDTLFVYGSVATGSVTNVETLDVRDRDGSIITVDTSLFTGLNTIVVRNEGQGTIKGVVTAQDHNAVFILNKLTAAEAANLEIQHSDTTNNGLDDNTLVANLASNAGAADLVRVSWADQYDTEARGINANPRFNYQLQTTGIENITLNDTDDESNTVLLGAGGFAIDTTGGTPTSDITGTITITGGQAGNFLNLDALGTGGLDFQTGLYGLSADDYLVGNASGDITLSAAQLESTANSLANVQDVGTAAVVRFTAATIDASKYASNVIVRVSDAADATGKFTPTGAQTITMGTGNDTVIFDKLNDTRAGLTISDTVNGGAGNDTLAIDGDGVNITLGASEWTNVSNFETIRLIGNGGVEDHVAQAYGQNSYNLRLTDDLIDHNGVAVAGGRLINIINDNDLGNELTGSTASGLTFAQRGVTIDARTLDANHSFTYNGEEGANNTADRFIMSDANINGMAIIDGGFAVLNTNAGNQDVLEARNSAVITVGDLAHVQNVGTLDFTNDTAAVQESFLQLNTGTIDQLVNSSHVATAAPGGVETLHILVEGNPLLAAASTTLHIDATGTNFAATTFDITTTGNTTVDLTGVTSGIVFHGGAGADTFTGGTGTDVFTGGAGADTFIFHPGDTPGGAAFTLANADEITDFATGTDKIDLTNIAPNVTIANGTADTFAQFLTNAHTAIAGATNVYVEYNVNGSGNTLVYVAANGNHVAQATDNLIVLDGISTAGQIAAADFA